MQRIKGDVYEVLLYKENKMNAQAAIKSDTLLRNGAYGIVMRGVQNAPVRVHR